MVLQHEHFVGMIEIEDKKELLASIKREDDLGNTFQQRGAAVSESFRFEITLS